MQYQQIYSIEFINKFNHMFNHEILKPTQEIGHQVPIKDIIKAIGFTIEYMAKEAVTTPKQPGKKQQKVTPNASVYYKNKLIQININQNQAQQRYVFATTLGRYLSKQITPEQSMSYISQMRFANEFLMPKPLVKRSLTNVAKSLGLNPSKVNKNDYAQLLNTMATDIGVQPTKLEDRLESLQLMWHID